MSGTLATQRRWLPRGVIQRGDQCQDGNLGEVSPARVLFGCVKSRLWQRLQDKATKGVLATEFYATYGLERSGTCASRVLVSHRQHRWVAMAHCFRHGGYFGTARVAAAGLVAPVWRRQCPCCPLPVADTLFRFLLECQTFVRD